MIGNFDQEHNLGKDLALFCVVNLDFIIFPIWICIFWQTFSSSNTLHCIPCKWALRFSFSVVRSSFPAYSTICSQDSSFFPFLELQGETEKSFPGLVVSWSKFLSLNCWEIRAWTADFDGNLGFLVRLLHTSDDNFS